MLKDEMTMPLSAVACILILLANTPFARGQDNGPPVELNPRHAHVLLYPKAAPDLKLYRSRELAGPPAIRLNERGAFVGDQLVCSWPGGRYDTSDSANMVLGYETPPVAGNVKYVPCPAGFPIISTWGDGGHGTATLLIEVSSRKGAIIEVRFAGKPYYLDLRSLPGDPRQPEPSLGMARRGVLGWEWVISGDEAGKAAKAAADRLRRRPAFARFFTEARACVSSAGAPQCFLPFVQEKLYFPEAGLADGHVTPEQFTNYVWKTIDRDGWTLWRHLRGCFVDGELSAAETAATIVSDDGWTCELEETRGGWKLVQFFQNPDAP
jgi:hypothetical protein